MEIASITLTELRAPKSSRKNPFTKTIIKATTDPALANMYFIGKYLYHKVAEKRLECLDSLQIFLTDPRYQSIDDLKKNADHMYSFFTLFLENKYLCGFDMQPKIVSAINDLAQLRVNKIK